MSRYLTYVKFKKREKQCWWDGKVQIFLAYRQRGVNRRSMSTQMKQTPFFSDIKPVKWMTC